MIDQVEDCLWCNEDVIVELCLKLLLIVSHSTISQLLNVFHVATLVLVAELLFRFVSAYFASPFSAFTP